MKSVSFVWIPREQNGIADRLSKKALDTGSCWTSQTEIAKSLGLSAIALGKKIDAAGLRKNGRPTPEAESLGVAMLVQRGIWHSVVWNSKTLIQILSSKGLL